MSRSSPLDRWLARPLGALLAIALAAVVLSTALPATDALARTRAKPTIVLVHGAFADASGFGAVTSRLQRRGYTVIAPANPLRGPASDAAYVASVIRTINGPIVLVAHSYGGAVITEAATEVSNVKALVYLNALALDAGGATSASPSASGHAGHRPLHRPGAVPLALRAGPAGQDGRPHGQCSASSVTGRGPGEGQDRVISPAAQRFMAKRAHAHTMAINSSHASYISHPGKVTKLILRAARKAG